MEQVPYGGCTVNDVIFHAAGTVVFKGVCILELSADASLDGGWLLSKADKAVFTVVCYLDSLLLDRVPWKSNAAVIYAPVFM